MTNKTHTAHDVNFWTDAFVPMLRQEVRRLKASAATFLTTSAATTVVIALFIYIFGDFFREKLPEIDPNLAKSSLFYLNAAALCFCSFIIANYVARKLRDPDNWLAMLSQWGVTDNRIAKFRRLAAFILNMILLWLSAMLLNRYLDVLTRVHWLLALSLPVINTLRYDFRSSINRKNDLTPHRSNVNYRLPPLVAWRMARLSQPAAPGATLRLVAGLPVIFAMIAIIREQPAELTYLASLSGGIILAWIVPLVVDDDLKTAWIERQAAVSHFEWIMSWQRIFTRIAIQTLAITIVCLCLAALIRTTMTGGVFDEKVLKAILISGFLAAFPVWLAPAFVMQIDGKKPATNIILMTLISVFVGSAVIAAPIIAPFTFLLHREAHRYQGGRFARGAYH